MKGGKSDKLLWLHMEADLPLRPVRRRREEGLQFSVDVAQHDVVHQEFAVDRRQSLEDVGPAREFLAHADEGPHNIYAHLSSLRAADHIGRLQCPMFGKGKGKVFPMPAASGL